jgi:hypothetical protein
MALGITQPVYCTREDVKRAADIKETARNNIALDRAIQSASRNIDKHMHRVFYPTVTTHYWDWPNWQRAYPWRLWFDQFELADVTSNVPVVTSGGTVIPANEIFWGPWNDSPPYTFMELNRGSNAAFGVASTPQQSISIQGTFGYNIESDSAGTLAAAVSSTSATTITVSDASLVGVGSLLLVDSERMIVQARAAVTTGQTNVSGATTASMADNAITVSSGSAINVDEVLLIDQEKMLVTDVTGNVVTVIRAWDGTVLATHSAATTIYAYRLLTVVRGVLGTTAATHSNSAVVNVHRVPTLIRDLCIAEALTRVLAETSGYAAGGDGGGEGSPHALTAALPDLWDEAETGYARKNRRRVV